MHRHMVGLVTAGMVIWDCGPAAAQVFTGPPAQWSLSVSTLNYNGQQIGGFSDSANAPLGVQNYDFQDSYGNQVVSQVGAQGYPSLVADVQGEITGGLGPGPGVPNGLQTTVTARASVRYDFIVVQTQAVSYTGPVPVDAALAGSVTTNLYGSTNASANASVNLTLDGSGYGPSLFSFGTGTNEFSYPSLFLGPFAIGSEHTVILNAAGNATINDPISASAYFQAILSDPPFIDPSFPYANDFAIVFNSTSVPEPSSLVLLAGVGVATWVARRWNQTRNRTI